MKRSLILFAKMPIPGRVKTRLHSVMTSGEAAELYRCMLHDTLSKVRRSLDCTSVTVYFEPNPGSDEYFVALARGMESVPQIGDDLGERMEAAFRRQFSLGNEAVVIIGTDIPHLPASFIDDAFALLENPETDVVFGPAADGGYYLLGMKRLHRELFKGLPWSSETVLRESMKKGERSGLRMALLPLCSDVDTPDDLVRNELLDEKNDAHLTRQFLGRFLAKQDRTDDRRR